MATKKEIKDFSKPGEETKIIKLFKIPGSDEEYKFVGINGKYYYLPIGEEIKVPEFVAAEIERAEEAQSTLDDDVKRFSIKESN